MKPEKACTRVTDEIINEFRLPRTTCYDFIWGRAHMLIAIGFDLGRSTYNPGKAVVSLDMGGSLVKVYGSIKAAAMDVDGDSSAISKICLQKEISKFENGRTRTYKPKIHKGYKWKFVDPDDHYLYRKIQ